MMRAVLRAVLAVMLITTASSASAQATLKSIEARGTLNCGINGSLIGFSAKDAQGQWRGFDVDYCRAIAAAVFADASKVTFVPLSAKDRFSALQSGEVDVLVRDTTWTSLRDTSLGLSFTGVTYYDHQAFLVRKLQVKSVADLNNVAICVEQDTTTELNLADFGSAHKLSFKTLTFAGLAPAISAYDSKRCDAYTSDYSGLLAIIHTLTAPDLHTILPDKVSKEPLGPAVRKGDDAWFDIVRWVHFAMLIAEESGVTSANVDEQRKSDIPAVKRLLGADGDQGRILGLANDWAYQIIKQVGNYGEVFDRNLGPQSRLKLPRGLNALWTAGGLQYAPPIR